MSEQVTPSAQNEPGADAAPEQQENIVPGVAMPEAAMPENANSENAIPATALPEADIAAESAASPFSVQEVLTEEMAADEASLAQPVGEALLKNILEAALLTSSEPLTIAEMKKLLEVAPNGALIENMLQQLQQEYSTRGIELTEVASGWRFRAKPEMQQYISRLNPQKQPRYSRAVMETLAIIAYRQPVTRGDIEEIRGVTVASQILKTLESRSWIEVIGTRDVPGKPELFATTQQFLDDLNLRSLHELPELEEMGNLLEQEAAEGAEEIALPPPDEETLAEAAEDETSAPQ